MPNRKLATQPPSASFSGDQDNKKIEDIITALDHLKKDAKSLKNQDIYRMINSTFSVCLHGFCMIRRKEMEKFYNANRLSKFKQVR